MHGRSQNELHQETKGRERWVPSAALYPQNAAMEERIGDEVKPLLH